MAKKTTEVSTTINEDTKLALDSQFPVDKQTQRISLPRIEMISQDDTEDFKNPKTGKKEIKVINEAGTFFISKPGEEENENGKKIWVKEPLNTSIEVIIIWQRKQLSHWDSANEQFTSSPVYDNSDEIIPLFCNSAEVERGLPSDLKKIPRFQGVTAAGKPTSKLEENKILYVIYNDEAYQMTIRGTSKFNYQDYVKGIENNNPSKVLTKLSSEYRENGAINWNAMTFEKVRDLTQSEAEEIVAKQAEIKSVIEAEKAQYANQQVDNTNLEKF